MSGRHRATPSVRAGRALLVGALVGSVLLLVLLVMVFALPDAQARPLVP